MAELHAEYGPLLQVYALRIAGGDAGRAADAVQETFIRAWQRPEVLDPARGSTRGWLLVTVRNILIDEFRARQRRPEDAMAELPERSDPVDEIDQLLSSTLLTEALRSLAQPHREAIIHCYYGGSTVNELAARLGLPPGTVKSRLFYGLRALRSALIERGVQT
ncbi:sigma-70 family RNA polymerase sigma factor [Nakamurella silvestris]|nr:sigma-70 family RNA polymerase sigma factor [Nakamurella silvestris]